MNIKINTTKNTRKVLVKIENLPKASIEGIRKGFLEMGAGLVRTFENQALNEAKFGRRYHESEIGGVKRLSAPSRNRPANYQASAAGQSPAILSGNYFESVYYKSHGSNGMEFGNTAEYASYLELGTKNMKARSGLFNSIKASLKNSRLYLEKNLLDNLK